MMFDAMCRAAEARMPVLAPKLRHASLIRMPGLYSEDLLALRDDFRMIWKTVAIEDDESCVLIERSGVSERIPVAGEPSFHTAIDRSNRVMTSEIGLRAGDAFDVAVTSLYDDGSPLTCYVKDAVMGRDVYVDGKNQGTVWGCGAITVASGHEARLSVLDGNTKAFRHAWESLVRDMAVALTQCALCARPGRWVLREVCASPRDPGASKKIPRSHQRDRWLSITDEERVRYFRSDEREPTGRHPIAHARRAHYRHIGENDDGTKKYTWVRACWVGSTEAEIRGQKYRVELEL